MARGKEDVWRGCEWLEPRTLFSSGSQGDSLAETTLSAVVLTVAESQLSFSAQAVASGDSIIATASFVTVEGRPITEGEVAFFHMQTSNGYQVLASEGQWEFGCLLGTATLDSSGRASFTIVSRPLGDGPLWQVDSRLRIGTTRIVAAYLGTTPIAEKLELGSAEPLPATGSAPSQSVEGEVTVTGSVQLELSAPTQTLGTPTNMQPLYARFVLPDGRYFAKYMPEIEPAGKTLFQRTGLNVEYGGSNGGTTGVILTTGYIPEYYESASGVVTFMEGDQVLGTAPITADGEAVFTPPSLPVGDHLITAHFAGDGRLNPSSSGPFTLRVVRNTLEGGLTVSAGSATLTLKADTRTQQYDRIAPTGTITFLVNGRVAATVPLSEWGDAAVRLREGSTCEFRYRYNGDANYDPFESDPYVYVVGATTSAPVVLNGTAGSDTIVMDADRITINGVSHRRYASQVSSVLLWAGGGDDVITLLQPYFVLTVSAGDGDDQIDFTPLRSVTIAGDGGNDWIVGRYRSGSNAIEVRVAAGDGNDIVDLREAILPATISGGAGHDVMVGTIWDDRIECDSGNDTVYANEGHDLVVGGSGAELVYGQGGNDSIVGYAAADTIYGDAGADVVSAGDGDDRIEGGWGKDTLYGNFGSDTIDGGVGCDWLMGGLDDDQLSGGGASDAILGGDGSDTLDGGAGNDYLEGKGKADTLHGGDGNDTLHGQAGSDMIHGDAGDDWVYVGDASPLLFRDTVYGGEGTDRIEWDAEDTVLEQEIDLLG